MFPIPIACTTFLAHVTLFIPKSIPIHLGIQSGTEDFGASWLWESKGKFWDTRIWATSTRLALKKESESGAAISQPEINSHKPLRTTEIDDSHTIKIVLDKMQRQTLDNPQETLWFSHFLHVLLQGSWSMCTRQPQLNVFQGLDTRSGGEPCQH